MANDLDRSRFRTAFELARDAQAAGLVVTCMAPHRHAHGPDGDVEFQVGLYQPDGKLWAEGANESAEQIREQIEGWLRRSGRDTASANEGVRHGE